MFEPVAGRGETPSSVIHLHRMILRGGNLEKLDIYDITRDEFRNLRSTYTFSLFGGTTNSEWRGGGREGVDRGMWEWKNGGIVEGMEVEGKGGRGGGYREKRQKKKMGGKVRMMEGRKGGEERETESEGRGWGGKEGKGGIERRDRRWKTGRRGRVR